MSAAVGASPFTPYSPYKGGRGPDPRYNRFGRTHTYADTFDGPALKRLDEHAKAGLVKSYAYTTGALGIIGTSALAASTLLPGAGLVLAIGGMGIGIAGLIGASCIGRERPGLKHLAWVGFGVGMGCALSPLALASGAALMQAAVMTTVVAACLTATAMLLPAGTFRGWQGPLLGALVGLSGLAMIGLLLPTSWALSEAFHQLLLWGGVVTFGAAMLVDTGNMLEAAQSPHFDPMLHSLQVTLNLLNLFVRFFEVVEKNRRKTHYR